MQQTLLDWAIVGVLAASVGGTASYAIKADRANAAWIGGTLGAIIGAAISTKLQDNRQRQTETELRVLREQVIQRSEWERLKEQLPALTAQVDNLRRVEQELGTVEGRFAPRQAELEEVRQRLITLTQEKQG